MQTQPRYVRLIHRLLGETWFVQRLSDAVALSRSTGTGLRFVTAAGELLDRDGSFVVGPRHSSAGIISFLIGVFAANWAVALSSSEAVVGIGV